MDEYGMDNYAGYEMESAYQPVSPYDFEEEERRKEELRRRLEEEQKQQTELASEVSRKEEITEYGDGRRTVKTNREIPAGGRVQPVAPTDYNANIARQESGNRPDIGYHDQSKSTAYGTYGLTNAAYQDARRVDPSLPQDIRQATPEQQTAAQTAFTQQNAKYLQNLGIEPTQQNLAAAHFLGAKGLSDYLRTGQVSEAAARANGGIENVKRIVNARLGGQPAPASGAAQLAPGETAGMPTQPARPEPISPEQAAAAAQPAAEGVNAGQGIRMPGQPAQTQSTSFIDRYQADQNDPSALMKLSTDETAPEFLRERSRNRAADLITQQREMKSAQEKLANASPSDLAKFMREKTTGGSWLKAIFYASIGAKSLAQAEGAKLGIGTEKVVTDANGQANIVKVAANGTPIEGYSAATGKKLSAEELVNAMGGAAAGASKVSTSAEQFQDKDGNIYRSQSNERGQLVTRNIVTGEVYKGDPTKLTRVRDVAQQTGDERKQEYKRENDARTFANSIRKLDYDSKLKAVAEFRQKAINRGEPDLTDAELSAMGVDRPDLGAARTQAAPAGQQPAAAPAAQAPAAQAGRVTPVAPTPLAGAGTTAVTPVAPSASGRLSPDEQDRVAAEKKLQREAESEVKTTEQKEFVKDTKPAIGVTASDGQAVSNARRQQLDIIRNNPSIINIMNGQGTQYDQARRIMINAVSGAYGAEERQQMATDLGQVLNKLTEAEQGALQEFVNLNTVVNAKTLRANAGPGAVSDAEQRANKEANVGNVDRIPAYAAMAGLHRSQFSGDLAASKQAFLQSNPQFKTTSEFNSAWQKQEALRLKEYQAIAKARFDVMGKAPSPNATPEAIKAYRDRVFRAFEAYPAPQYDAGSNKWNYQTANARRAAMAAVLGQ